MRGLSARVLASLAWFVVAAVSPVAAADAVAVPPPAVAPASLDASADRLEAKVVIPEPARKVGEVRLLSRGNAVVVQTLLSTKLLSRVTGEIRKKEEANWPAAAAGREDAVAYLEALEAVRVAVERRSPGVDWADRRRRLLIEFVADAGGQAVLLGTFTTASGTTDLTPASREVLGTLTPSRAYVLRNMRLILSDSFKVPEAEVDRIGPLGPAAGAATVKGASGSSASDGTRVGAPVAPDVDARPATEVTGR